MSGGRERSGEYCLLLLFAGMLASCSDILPFSASDSDTRAPARPAGLRAEGGSGSVRLVWDPSPEEDLKGYNVFRGRSGNEYLKANPAIIPASGDPTFLDTLGLVNGETYHYVVTAVDNAGNESNYSGEVGVTPGP